MFYVIEINFVDSQYLLSNFTLKMSSQFGQVTRPFSEGINKAIQQLCKHDLYLSGLSRDLCTPA